MKLALHVLPDAERQRLHGRHSFEEQDALENLFGVLHLADRLLPDVLAEPMVSPVVAHFRVHEVLIDGRQLFLERLVQLRNNILFALHESSFDGRACRNLPVAC